MIGSHDIAKHLEYGVRRGFLNGMNGYTPLSGPFVRRVESSGASETYADLGDQPWPVQVGGMMGDAGSDATGHARVTGSLSMGQPSYIEGVEERAQIVYNVDFEIKKAVLHNTLKDDRTGELEIWMQAAGENYQKHMDYLAFKALEDGEGSAYGRGYDGLTFFNDAHIDPRAAYTTGQDNKYALGLSIANFATVQVAGSKFLDSRGNPAMRNHSLLIVPPDLKYDAYQISSNPEVSTTANRAKNPYMDTQVIVAPATWFGATTWVLVDASSVLKPLTLQMRQQPELTIWDDEDAPGGGVRYYKWHARYAIAYGNWRYAIMGNT